MLDINFVVDTFQYCVHPFQLFSQSECCYQNFSLYINHLFAIFNLVKKIAVSSHPSRSELTMLSNYSVRRFFEQTKLHYLFHCFILNFNSEELIWCLKKNIVSTLNVFGWTLSTINWIISIIFSALNEL